MGALSRKVLRAEILAGLEEQMLLVRHDLSIAEEKQARALELAAEARQAHTDAMLRMNALVKLAHDMRELAAERERYEAEVDGRKVVYIYNDNGEKVAVA